MWLILDLISGTTVDLEQASGSEAESLVSDLDIVGANSGLLFLLSDPLQLLCITKVELRRPAVIEEPEVPFLSPSWHK